MDIKKSIQKATSAATDATVAGAAAGAEVVAGAAKTTGAAPFPANIPLIVGYAVQGAAIIASVISAVKKVKGAKAPSANAGGSGGGSGGAPQANFNIVGQSSNNLLAETIASKQNQPIETFVVGNSVTTQQSLDANKIKNSTFI